MSCFDQTRAGVCCEWGISALSEITRPDVIVIVDVLSFGTAVDVAVSRGAVVFPQRGNDRLSFAYASSRGAALAGPRDCGGISLSPQSLMRAQAGAKIVLPSPNGSRIAFEAASLGATVLVACLRNASAVASTVRSIGGRILVVPAGERWPDGSLRPCLEDLIGAGAVIDALSGQLSPEAAAAAAVFRDAKDDLLDRVMECASGRELVECGFSRDVELAAELNVSSSVPILRHDALVAADAVLLHRASPAAV